MSSSISIGGENYYKSVSQQLPAGDKDLLFAATEPGADIFFRLGDSIDETSFNIMDSAGIVINKVKSSGKMEAKIISKIPNDSESAGSHGDLVFQARLDDEATAPCNLRFHYDANIPQMNVQAQMLSILAKSGISGVDSTFTANTILTGHIERDPGGVKRTDAFPSAADLIAVIVSPKIGDVMDIMIENTGTVINDDPSTQPWIELTTPSDTWAPAVGQNTLTPGETKMYKIVITAITPTPTYSIYNFGTSNRIINNNMQILHNNPNGSGNIDIDTTYANIAELLDDESETITIKPTSATSNMFTYSGFGVKNRGPPCNVKFILRVACGKNGADQLIHVKVKLFKNGVAMDKKIISEIKKKTYSSPQITNVAYTLFEPDDILTARIAKTSGSSVIKIFSLQILVLQI